MAITLLNPDGVVKVPQLHQVSIATGSKLVFIAGQVSWDADGATVGAGNLAAQVEQCYLNVAAALAGASATFDDVAKLTVFIVDWNLDKLPQFEAGVAGAAARLGIDPPQAPLSAIGMSAGFSPDLLVEVEAIAMVD